MLRYSLLQFAQKITVGSGDGNVDNVPTVTLDGTVNNILNTAYFIAGVVAIIVFIVGGIMFTTSSGSAESVKKAKNLITYAVVGLIVISSAFAITNFVIGAF